MSMLRPVPAEVLTGACGDPRHPRRGGTDAARRGLLDDARNLADPGLLQVRHSLARRSVTASRPRGEVGRQSVDRQLVEASLPVPPSRLGPIGVARVDRGAKGSEDEIGAAIDVPPRKWVPFPPPRRRRLRSLLLYQAGGRLRRSPNASVENACRGIGNERTAPPRHRHSS